MKLELTLRQITDLCTKDFIEVEFPGESPQINDYVYISYKDIELDGLVKKIKADKDNLVAIIEKVDIGLKEEWFSCVRSLNKVNKQEANLLIHMLLDRLCRNGDWEEIDKLINLIKPETEDLDIILSFLVSTSPTESCRALKKRKWLYDSAYPRLKKAITTWGVLENLRGDVL